MKSKRLVALVVGVVCAINGLGVNVGANPIKEKISVEGEDNKKSLTPALNDYLNNKNEKAKTFVADDKSDIFNITKSEKKQYKANDQVRVIVELEDNKNIKGTEEEVKSFKFAKQDDVITNFKSVSENIDVKNRYYKGTNSFSIDTTYGDLEKISELKNLEGVRSVKIAKTYGYQMLSSADLVNTEKVWEENKFKGEGTVVAIVDTGVDYEHRDFALSELGLENRKIIKEEVELKLNETVVDDVWLSEKIPVAYDWADGDSDVRNPYNEHGTHVAGIVAANGNENINGIKGVAPEAQIIVEKVFGDYSGGAYDDDIAAGIYHAVDMGADVINLSLGTDAGWVDEEDLTQKAIKYAADNGVLVVAAGGNASYSTDANIMLPWVDKPFAENYDIGVVGSPGISPYALQVASYENTHRVKSKGITIDSKGEEGTLALFNQARSKKFVNELDLEKEYELVYVGEGSDNDYKGKDVEGRIAVITPEMQYSTYTTFQYAAERKGAIAVIMVPHEGSPIDKNLMLSMSTVPLATTSTRAEGMEVVEKLSNGENVKFKITDDIIQTESAFKDTMSDFSSWGTGANLELKPEISAPGGNIYSTVSGNSYEEMSGTSMASPYVAGGAALVIQGLKNNDSLKDENLVTLSKKILMNTSEVVVDKDTGVPYSVRKQGSGLMKLDKAVNTSAVVYRKDTVDEKSAAVELKSISDEVEFDLVLESLGNHSEAIDYNVSLDVLTDRISSNEYDYDEDGTVDKVCDQLDMKSILLDGAVVTINGQVVSLENPYNISLNSGEKKELKINIDLKNAKNLRKDTFVEGFVNLRSESSSDLVVPYMGFYGAWEEGKNVDLPAWDENSFIPFTAVWNTVEDGPYPLGLNLATGQWELNKVGISSTSIFDAVAPKFTLLRNVDSVAIEVVDKEGNIVNNLGYAEDWFGNVLKLGKSIMSYNDYNLAFAEWNGLDENGNKLSDGDYKFKIKTVGQYDNASEQIREITIKLDNTPPVMTNLNAEVSGDGTLVTWDVEDTGVGFDGVIVYYDDQYISTADPTLTEVWLPKKDIKDLTVVAIDSVLNLSINNYGDTTPNYEYLVNFGRIYGDVANFETGLNINQFSVKKVDWKVSVKNLAGEEVHSYEEKYTANFVPEPVCIPKEIKDGEYYVEITATDEVGYSVTSEPHFFKVVGNDPADVQQKSTALKAIETNKEDVKLNWNASASTDTMEYILYKDGKEIDRVPADKDVLEYSVTGLRSNTIYGFKVVSRSKTGILSKPVSLNVRTAK
ncbi:S8 family serine peptidase [Clostridium sp.]|uniref:S8 family serine peptidase n=1 Tax=Clostridium sp. TaxID=1506 RepID=UPI003F3B52F9